MHCNEKHFWAFAIQLNLNQFSFNLGKCLNELKQAQMKMQTHLLEKQKTKTRNWTKKKTYWNGKLEKIKSINNKYAQLNSMCSGRRRSGTAGGVAQASAPQMKTGHLIKHGK